jgi:TPR repeat protein
MEPSKTDEYEKYSQKKYIKRALSIFKYAANHGCLDTQLLFSKMYDKGDHLHIDSNEAFQYYTQAAKHGNSEAIYKVGYMYLEGRGIKQEYIKAHKYITQAAEKGCPDAKSLLVTPIKEAIKNIDYLKVLKMFEVATLKGTASLEYNVGYFYENGFYNHNSQTIIEEDFFKALEWYRLAAKKNNPEAIFKLGTFYQIGKLCQNSSVAVRYYKKGAELEHFDSFYALAQFYLVGEGVTEDVEMAFNLFSQAASLGHPGARSVLSLLYGFDNMVDISLADKSIKKMMEEVGNNGNVVVQYRLRCYYEFSGDTKLAIRWYELATQGKLTDAYYRLGRIYETKKYQSFPKAIELYEAASDNYHDKATYKIAQLYHYGIGVSQNYSTAFHLYTKAADLGNWSATALLDIKQVFKRNCVDTSSDTESSNNTAIGNKLLNLTSEEFNELLLMHEGIAKHADANQQYNMGYVYENYLETPDYEKAFQWYSIAASRSHKETIHRLGLFYLNGDGVLQNQIMAVEEFKKAMDLGSANACYQLGLMHDSDDGEDIDKSKEEHYYLAAAYKGHRDAQFKLGKLYEDLYIKGKDSLDALTWYTKAYFQENSHAITHLYILDGKQDFEKEFYSKLFKKKWINIKSMSTDNFPEKFFSN